MPTIKLENCTHCLKCVKECPSDAINIEEGSINDTCIHCGHCVAVCPEATVLPDSEDVKKLQPSGVSPHNFENLSAGVRTCRSFLNKEIDHETFNLLVENMKHYPSASNARPVEICIVKNKEAIQSLNNQTALMLIKKLQLVTSPLLRPLIQLFSPDLEVPKLVYYKKRFIARQMPESSQVCHHAPAIMLFHAPVTKYGMGEADANIWATYTSIYANTLGLGTCFNGFIVKAMDRSKTLRKEFQIPASNRVYAALLLGYPKVKYTHEAGRAKPEVKIL